MHKLNLIVLSLLFILSVTTAAPQPEQALVKRTEAETDNIPNGDYR